MVKGKPKQPKGNAFAKRRRDAEEEDVNDLDHDAVEELKKLVEEAQHSRPKDKKAKKRTPGAPAEEEEDEESENDELSDEERVLRELKAENEGENDGEEDEEMDDEEEKNESPVQSKKANNPNKRRADKPYVNDAATMRSLAAEIQLEKFGESLVVSDDTVYEEKLNPEEDKLREGRFVEIATRAVNNGRRELDTLKIPHRRPTDFMAEMIKSDDHMARVKRRLLFEQQKMKVVESRKAAQRNKKRQKEVKKKRDGDRVIRKKEAAEIAASYRDKNPGSEERPNKRMKTGGSKKGPGAGKSNSAKPRLGKNKRGSMRGKRK